MLYIHIKRILDFILSFVLLLLLSPVILLIIVMIKLFSKGPAFFVQTRPGLNGKPFKVYKFRTMRVETELSGVPLSDMERMTRVGKFLRATSLDEISQFFNVLKGDMSFIGPRPLLVEYLEYYTERQAMRHNVLPGITGWAQVNGRNSISWEQRFEYDVFYVENIGFLFDLKIVVKTIINILKKSGINSSENETMEKFRGGEESVPVIISR